VHRPCCLVGAPIGLTIERDGNDQGGREYLLELILLCLLIFEGLVGLLVERLGCELGYVSHTLACMRGDAL
jgi:hypothetical protein